MNIGFDAKRFFNNYTGLGNYSRFVVESLAANNPDSNLFLFSPSLRSNDEVNKILALQNIFPVLPSGFSRLPGGSIWRSWLMSFDDHVEKLDIFHGLSQELPFGLNHRIKKVVTVHDLIFMRYPQYYNPVDVFIYKQKVKSACSRADKVIAISSQTADDLIAFLDVEPGKIEVVYQGCHPNFLKVASDLEKERVKKKYQLPENFILNVGTIEERKNVELLVDALGRMPEFDRIPVVIVGRATPYLHKVQSTVERLGLQKQVFFRHKVSFSDLPVIYQAASVFVYPSLFEGFGIPLIEAIQSGIPVITSTGSCFQEAAGPDAIYSDPHDADELARHLQKVLSDNLYKKGLISGSREFIRKFEPAIIARDLMKVYRSALSSG